MTDDIENQLTSEQACGTKASGDMRRKAQLPDIIDVPDRHKINQQLCQIIGKCTSVRDANSLCSSIVLISNVQSNFVSSIVSIQP